MRRQSKKVTCLHNHKTSDNTKCNVPNCFYKRILINVDLVPEHIMIRFLLFIKWQSLNKAYILKTTATVSTLTTHSDICSAFKMTCSLKINEYT